MLKYITTFVLTCNVLHLFGAAFDTSLRSTPVDAMAIPKSSSLSSVTIEPQAPTIETLETLCHHVILKDPHTCREAPKVLPEIVLEQIAQSARNALKPKGTLHFSEPLTNGNNGIQAYAISDDKRLFTLASFGFEYKRIDNVIRVYDLQSGKKVGQCRNEDYIAFDTMFLSHNQTILFAIQKALTEHPSRLCLFDANNYTYINYIKLSFRPIGSSSNIALSHDDKTIYEAVENIIRRIDIESGITTEETAFPENIIDITLSEDDRHLFVGCSDKVIQCDAQSLAQLKTIQLDTRPHWCPVHLSRLSQCNNTLLITKQFTSRKGRRCYPISSLDLTSENKKNLTSGTKPNLIKHTNMHGWAIAFQNAGEPKNKIQVYDHENKLRLELTDTDRLLDASDKYLLFKNNNHFALLDIRLAAGAIEFLKTMPLII